MHIVLVHDTEKDVLDLITVALQMEDFIVYPLLNINEDFLI